MCAINAGGPDRSSTLYRDKDNVIYELKDDDDPPDTDVLGSLDKVETIKVPEGSDRCLCETVEDYCVRNRLQIPRSVTCLPNAIA